MFALCKSAHAAPWHQSSHAQGIGTVQWHPQIALGTLSGQRSLWKDKTALTMCLGCSFRERELCTAGFPLANHHPIWGPRMSSWSEENGYGNLLRYFILKHPLQALISYATWLRMLHSQVATWRDTVDLNARRHLHVKSGWWIKHSKMVFWPFPVSVQLQMRRDTRRNSVHIRK